MISEISKGLFLGNHETIRDRKLFDSHKITHVLYIGNETTEAEKSRAIWKTIRVNTDCCLSISKYFSPCNEYIKSVLKSNKNILVCCESGECLAPAFIIAYIMSYKSSTFAQAFEFVKNKHPCIKQSPEIISQLREYQNFVLSRQKRKFQDIEIKKCFIF
ncbi:unnamed protein product [Blepharisma stoltei]|uniref:protein-tyrosine-phosphatase n=1 Tax=Blepharisma stoltei TaxID=1481888 RepID=A0AAU9IF74_9CILI|nr:unnamed protein product [Blepharisma stoltei]